MPVYSFECPKGHTHDRFIALALFDDVQRCECGEILARRIHAPRLVRAAQDLCYDSPIDGRPITSHDARQEDLKRSGCEAYDPGVKTDYHRRQRDSDTQLERAMGETVEAAIQQMPSTTRTRLYAEMESHDVGTTRLTGGGK